MSTPPAVSSKERDPNTVTASTPIKNEIYLLKTDFVNNAPAYTKLDNSMLPSVVKDFIAGGVGGAMECLMGHPLDTVKVRLQMQCPKSTPGMTQTFLSIFKQEGFFGLYRGVSSPLTGLAFINAAMFSSYGKAKSVLGESETGQKLPLYKIFLAGAVSGCVVSLIESPIDLLKCQLQMQYKHAPGDRQYHGLLDCFNSIFKQKGIRGLYQGLIPTLARNTPGQGIHFLTYEAVIRKLQRNSENEENLDSPSLILMAGAASGIILIFMLLCSFFSSRDGCVLKGWLICVVWTQL